MNLICNIYGPDFDVGFPATNQPRNSTERMPRDGIERMPRDGIERMPCDGIERMPRDGIERMPRDGIERMLCDGISITSSSKRRAYKLSVPALSTGNVIGMHWRDKINAKFKFKFKFKLKN